MSYNITAWKIRSMRLELPLNFDFQHWLQSQPDRDEQGHENIGKRWCMEERQPIGIEYKPRNNWKLSVLGKELWGVIVDNKLIATAIRHWTSDCSGHLYSDILIPLFKEFHGNLKAIIIWEGGDSAVNLRIYDGIVEERDITEDSAAENTEAQTVEGSIYLIEDSIEDGKRLKIVD